MAPDIYFIPAAGFALSTASTVAIAARSPSRWRFATPLTIALGCVSAYLGLDAVSGTAKPVGTIPGWTRPNLKAEGATVLSATQVGDDAIVLTLQEGRGAEPRLFRFAATDDLKDALKRAMEAHAATHDGERFGFSMQETGDGSQQGQGRPGTGQDAGKPGTGDGRDDAAGRTPYRFAEPVQAPLPPKI